MMLEYCRTLCLATILTLLLVQTQAQIFSNFFGGGQQQHEAREQEAPPSGDANWFEARVEAATCTQYLCPRTLSCVTSPANCPCPFPHQIRCPFPNSATDKMDNGGHICIQEANCDSVSRARSLGSSFKIDQLKNALIR